VQLRLPVLRNDTLGCVSTVHGYITSSIEQQWLAPAQGATAVS
jgi:hypothetical protein